MKGGRLGILQYVIQKKAQKRIKQMQNGEIQDYMKDHVEQFKKDREHLSDKQKKVLKYQHIPYLGYFFGFFNYVVGIYLNLTVYLGEHQQLWSRLSQNYIFELTLGTSLILLGWFVMIFLERESLKIDRNTDLIIIKKKRIFQKPLKQIYPIKSLSYFQIWKHGYISRQNNTMQYKLIFFFGKRKVTGLIRLNSIEIKKIFVEIKCLLDQEYKREELRMIDEKKYLAKGYERLNEEETALDFK